MVYDDTCRGSRLLPGLTHSWIVGGWLYRLLGRIDHMRGVQSWGEALHWLSTVELGRQIGEIQFWGHGKWGLARVGAEQLDMTALQPDHPYHPMLRAVRERLIGPNALWWFRTCETFGCRPGHRFAKEWTRFFGCRAAGHTYIIGPWQSGLHCLRPGETPGWSVYEGLAEGTPENPEKALWSKPWEPNTITCLQNRHPQLDRGAGPA